MPRMGNEPRRIVQSRGASSPARRKCRSAASWRPARWRCQARVNSARAACCSRVGRSWCARISSGASTPFPSSTQARTAARKGSEGLPVSATNVSVPNCTSFGRTIQPRSSIQIMVGTLMMLKRSAVTCSVSMSAGCPGAARSMYGRASSKLLSSATVTGVKPRSPSSSYSACQTGRSSRQPHHEAQAMSRVFFPRWSRSECSRPRRSGSVKSGASIEARRSARSVADAPRTATPSFASTASGRSSSRAGARFEGRRVLLASHLVQQHGVVLEQRGDLGVVRAVAPLADGEGAPVERLGLAELALLAAEFGQVVEALRQLGVVRPEGLLVDGERAPVERLGVRVPALRLVEERRLVEVRDESRIVHAERLLLDGERLLVERLGQRELPLLAVELGERIERGPHVGAILPECALAGRADAPVERLRP